MRLKELFENLDTIIYYSPEVDDLTEESETLEDIERSIIDSLVYARAQNLEHIYLHHIEDRVRKQGMEIPKDFLMDFLMSRPDIEKIAPIDAKHHGDEVFEIVFTDQDADVHQRVDQDKEAMDQEMIDRKAKAQAKKNVKDKE